MNSSWDEADEEVRARVARLAELGLLTASLLHELRQPLFAIKATAEVALGSDGVGMLAWQRVFDAAQHLEALVDQHGGVGRLDDEATVVDLNEPVRAALAMLDARARQSGARVRVQLHDGPVWVRAKEGELRQVAVNLVINALDAVEDVDTRDVVVCTRIDGMTALLAVEDAGPGVPQDVLARAFEPFVTSKPAGRGTGLGLYITRVLVQRSGGDVQLTSATGGGTRVHVRLPVQRAAAGATRTSGLG